MSDTEAFVVAGIFLLSVRGVVGLGQDAAAFIGIVEGCWRQFSAYRRAKRVHGDRE